MGKRMKKSISFALSVLLAFGSLAGCNKKTDEPAVTSTQEETDIVVTAPKTEASVTEAPVMTPEEPATTATPETSGAIKITQAEEIETTTGEQPEDPQAAFAEFLSALTQYLIGNSYYTASTVIEHPEEYGFVKSKLNNFEIANYRIPDPAAQAETEKNEKLLKEKLDSIDREGLTDQQKLTYDKLQYEFDIDARVMKQALYASPLSTAEGFMSQFGIALYNIPFDDEGDLIGYQKILSTLPNIMKDMIGYVQYQKDTLGYEPSDSMIQKSIEYALKMTEPENNPLLDAFDSKLAEMDLPESQKEVYIRMNREYVTQTLFPALKQFAEDVKQFDTADNETKGLCHYKGGSEYYDIRLRSLLGVEMTPKEIFDYIEDSLDRDIGRMRVLGLTAMPEVLALESGNYEVPYDKTSVTSIAEYYTKALAEDFPMELLPEYDIKDLPPALQIDGLGAYYVPPKWGDDSPRIIRVNPKLAAPGGAMELDITLVHEGFGGHMLQYECAGDNEKITLLFSELGYTEGWAVYAEHEAINYSGVSEKMAELMRINTSLGYDVEALADIGVNALGWTRDQLQAYLNEKIGLGQLADAIYDDVIASPGTLLPYSFGPIKTRELIEKYKAAHPDDLDVKEMHRKYMSIGSTSFDVVEKYFLGK